MAKHLVRDMEVLKHQLLDTAALVESSIHKSIVALLERNQDVANEVIHQDERIDEKEVRVEEECLKILALHQPVAADLRYIIAFLKVNNDIERMGDQAVNIAQYAASLSKKKPLEVAYDFAVQAEFVQEMVRKSLDSLTNMDSALAREVLLMDDRVDDSHREAFEIIQKVMREDSDNVERGVYLLSCSKQLERIADLATNIAEDIIYMVEGDVVRHRNEATV